MGTSDAHEVSPKVHLTALAVSRSPLTIAEVVDWARQHNALLSTIERLKLDLKIEY